MIFQIIESLAISPQFSKKTIEGGNTKIVENRLSAMQIYLTSSQIRNFLIKKFFSNIASLNS